ncbi:MAG: outer membrane beta-barrel protein [Candidatus Omnitrophica bacterium]|nr:outer membrane beta-barrel protein [Candidatus Omnitrophota bacterium]MBU1128894.1 outer membrane beta-barrel protein [Candidatus Omnitrophota bacterium]MBU1784075.1 outer membrane beta-barrel protein [Candidatus Omnitrophota bacterium]MBU1851383.1 outer membrane beta-barrel protein [Candidatus Omnitrophota bacterium]
MNRKILFMIVIFVLILAYQPAVFAQPVMSEGFIEGDPRTNVGVAVSAFVPSGNEFQTGFYVGGQVSYDLAWFFGLGAECGYLQSEIKGNGVNAGTFRGAPLLGDIILKVPMDMHSFVFTPYAIVGLGCLISNVQVGDEVTDNGTIETNVPFLVKFGGGFDFVIHESVIINFEASYHYAQVDFNEKLINQTFGLGKTDLNAGYIGGGVKYRF